MQRQSTKLVSCSFPAATMLFNWGGGKEESKLQIALWSVKCPTGKVQQHSVLHISQSYWRPALECRHTHMARKTKLRMKHTANQAHMQHPCSRHPCPREGQSVGAPVSFACTTMG